MAEVTPDSGPQGLAAPSTLDLVRLSPRLLFPPGGEALYRQVALLADLSVDDEVLVAGSGNGVTLEYFVREYGVHGSGVDFDESMVAVSAARARELDLADRMQFQHAPLDRLPYRDEIFHVAVGELGLTAHADPEAAVRDLVRVTRPGGTVVLLQLVWKAPVDKARRQVLASHLGVRPMMLVEWKRLLREAGLHRLHTEDWSDEETAFRPRIAKPFPDFAELFSLREKIGIFRRAWRRWGWNGVKAAIRREREVHRLLTRERILGLDLVKGVKRGGASEASVPAPGVSDEALAESLPGTDEGPVDAADEPGEIAPDAVVESITALAPEPQVADDEVGGSADSGMRSDAGPDDEAGKRTHAKETEGLPLFGAPDAES